MSQSIFVRVGVILTVVASTMGCSGIPLRARTAPPLASEVTTRGETIYFGRVFPLKSASAEPFFVYERRVAVDVDSALVSTHLTRDPSGNIALAESAKHSPDYALFDYTLHRNQLGQTGTIHVERDQVTFRLRGEREREGEGRSAVETQAGDVVVGPTLVGYIVRHFEALRSSKVLSVRLAVLDRLETIGFELEKVAAEPGQLRVRMTASSFIYRLVVDPLYFTFEASTGKLVRLEGRVPPKVAAGSSWEDLDARVEYRFVASTYR
jgi:hypothetical protein